MRHSPCSNIRRRWTLAALALLAPLAACRKDGRTTATEASPPLAAADASAALADANDAPSPNESASAAAPHDAGDGNAASPPFVEPLLPLPAELPVHLVPRDRGLDYSTSVVAAGGGGSVIVATSTGNHAGYVFEHMAAGWVETFRFELSAFGQGASDEVVAVSGDGDTIAVALQDSPDCTGGECPTSRAVGFFERRPGGWARTPNLPVTQQVAFQGIGYALALDAAGDTLVATLRDAPVVYVFERMPEGSWREAARLAPDVRGFGPSVALDGDTIAVGAPVWDGEGISAVLLFERRAGSWVAAGRLDAPPGADRTFGMAVALAGDVLVAGGYGEVTDRGGAAFVFERSGDGWRKVAQLERRPATEKQMYGRIVALWPGGRVAAVQSLFSAHFFARDTSAWKATEVVGGQQSPEELDRLAPAGPAVALSVISDILLRAVPGLDADAVPPVPVRPELLARPDCRYARACLRGCSTDADCCPQPPCATDMWAMVCRDAVCLLAGCTNDEECASIPDTVCVADGGPLAVKGRCLKHCTADADCQSPFVCLAAGVCDWRPDHALRCYSDLDCSERSGQERCDAPSGCCTCADDEYCRQPLHGGPGTRCVAPRP